jgi:hypothetical protein
MIRFFCFGLILSAWVLTLGSLTIAAVQSRRNGKRFPNPLSAWWLIVLVVVAIGPPEIVDRVANQVWRVEFVSYVFAVTLPFLGLAPRKWIAMIDRDRS